MFKNKKQIKIVALVVVALFIIGMGGLALSQSGSIAKAAGSSTNTIGVVDYQQLEAQISQTPEAQKVKETMQAEFEQAKKDYDAKSANMNDQEKQEYSMQLQQRLSLKQQELMAPIKDKVNAAVKAVAEAKGLSVVLDKGNVVYGGVDITDDVLKKFNGK